MIKYVNCIYIGIISSNESMKPRMDYRNAQIEYQKTIGSKNNEKVLLNEWMKKINSALAQIDDISLGLEHFYRELGKLYELTLIIRSK